MEDSNDGSEDQMSTLGDGELIAELLRINATEKLEEAVPAAVKAIDEAEKACGGDVPQLQAAAQRLLVCQNTTPLGRVAAEAQLLVRQSLNHHQTLQQISLDDQAWTHIIKKLKNADRAARDVVIFQCRSCCEDHRSRNEFIVKLTAAYNGQLGKEVRAQLLLAYDKTLPDVYKPYCFESNNKVAADRRGAPRPKRERQAKGNGPPATCVGCGAASAKPTTRDSETHTDPVHIYSDEQLRDMQWSVVECVNVWSSSGEQDPWWHVESGMHYAYC